MRNALLLSFVLAGAIEAGAETQGAPPAQPQPGTSQPRPAPTAPGTAAPAPGVTPPAQPRRAPVSTRGGMAITVTGPGGMTLQGVHLEVTGPTDRSGETDQDGRINFPGLLAGTYRLAFTGKSVIAFEREVALRGGLVADIDVLLNPAPEPPPPPPPPPAPAAAPTPAPAAVGPKGQPLTLGIVELLDKQFIGKEPRRESLLSCSGNERTTMIQLNEPMPQRLYEEAEAVYYVLGGEGNVTIDGRTSRIATNGFLSVPRGTLHAFERRGNRPLVLLAVLSGERCETPK